MFNLIDKQQRTLFVGSQGITLKDGLGISLDGENKTIEKGTLIEIIAFNFDTCKARVRCIKETKSYIAEIDYNYLLNECVFEPKSVTTPVEALQVNNYTKRIMDKETINFLLTQVLIFIVGVLLGRSL